jgi:hypothetical protein
MPDRLIRVCLRVCLVAWVLDTTRKQRESCKLEKVDHDFAYSITQNQRQKQLPQTASHLEIAV